MAEDRKRDVAVVLPAYEEEARIARVLQAVLEAKLPTEIIVVSDGSKDRTAEIARGFPGVHTIELPRNVGKGGAMQAGVHATKASIVAFIDADLEGLRGTHVDQIILPLLTEECDMCVGIFREGKRLSDAAQWVAPSLSGQRAMTRELFESVPYVGELRLGVEVALNKAARRRQARVLRVILRGVANCYKEEKMGFVKGMAARTRMYKEITEAMIKTRPRRSRRRW